MCLIIEAKPEHNIKFQQLENFMRQNQDGWGIMLQPEDDAVPVVYKGMGIHKLWKAYRELKARPMYIHLRMATHGDVKESNTHPYPVLDDLWLMHNGIITAPEYNTARSDTWHFIEYILKPLLEDSSNRYDLIRSSHFAWLMYEYLGNSNRLVFMDRQGAVTLNSDNWHTIKSMDMRVSNTYAWSAYPAKPKVKYNAFIHNMNGNANACTTPIVKSAAESAVTFVEGNRDHTKALHPYENDAWRNETTEHAKWEDEYAEWQADARQHVGGWSWKDEVVEDDDDEGATLDEQAWGLQSMSAGEIEAFVYQEPDLAAKLLHYLVK